MRATDRVQRKIAWMNWIDLPRVPSLPLNCQRRILADSGGRLADELNIYLCASLEYDPFA